MQSVPRAFHIQPFFNPRSPTDNDCPHLAEDDAEAQDTHYTNEQLAGAQAGFKSRCVSREISLSSHFNKAAFQ